MCFLATIDGTVWRRLETTIFAITELPQGVLAQQIEFGANHFVPSKPDSMLGHKLTPVESAEGKEMRLVEPQLFTENVSEIIVTAAHMLDDRF